MIGYDNMKSMVNNSMNIEVSKSRIGKFWQRTFLKIGNIDETSKTIWEKSFKSQVKMYSPQKLVSREVMGVACNVMIEIIKYSNLFHNIVELYLNNN